MQNIGEVVLGNNTRFDEGVLLGYLSPRKGISPVLKIGADSSIRSGTVIYAGSTIGGHLETGHNVVIREENEIGAHFNIWNNLSFYHTNNTQKRIRQQDTFLSHPGQLGQGRSWRHTKKSFYCPIILSEKSYNRIN